MKFIKPIYAYYFLCESDFLLTTTWKEIRKWSGGNENHVRQTRQTLMYFVKEFSNEFDYRAEYNFTQNGKVYEEKDKITSVIIKKCALNPFPVFVMSAIRGDGVDDILEALEKEKRNKSANYCKNVMDLYTLSRILYKKWIENAIWGDGFFHADLHPGNLIIEHKDGKNLIHVLDYGSSGKLSKKQQCKLLNLMVISSKIKEIEMYANTNPDKMMYIMNTTENRKKHDQNIKTMVKFIKAVNSICDVKMKNETVTKLAPYMINYIKGNSFNQLFTRYLEFAEDIGSCSNNALILFGRGLTYLDNLMYRIGEICENDKVCSKEPVGGVIKELVLKHLYGSVKCVGLNLVF